MSKKVKKTTLGKELERAGGKPHRDGTRTTQGGEQQ